MEPYLVTTVEQVRALASPIRSRIMDIMRQGEERSVAELARMVGETGAATHYHVERLVSVGLAVLSGRRPTGPRTERLYKAVSNKIRILPRSDSAEYMEALLDWALSRVRRLEREITAAYQAEPSSSETPPVRIISKEGRVASDDMVRLQALIEEAAELLKGSESSEGEPFALRAYLIQLPKPV